MINHDLISYPIVSGVVSFNRLSFYFCSGNDIDLAVNNAGSQTEEGHSHFEGMTVPVAIWGVGGGGLDTQVYDITIV